jgi:CRISPR system Cascade subunit CasA
VELDMKKFSLLHEPWIPVLRAGRVEELGVEQALLKAHEIVRIETPSPLEETALHRLLLAVLHRALRGPKRAEDALEWWREGRFPDDLIRTYLSHYQERFFLFHPEAPFLQVADLPEEPAPWPWTKLLPERAGGNNPTLFDHNTDDSPPKASYPQAARALLVHQTFVTGGLLRRLGVTSAEGAPLARAAAFLPAGDTLFQTLIFNLVPYTEGHASDDAPIWEVQPLSVDDLRDYRTVWPFSGITRVYTWPSRAVRFLDEGDGVRLMAYGPGVKPGTAVFRDPMVALRKGNQGDAIPLRLDVDRSFWRDFASMLPSKEGSPPATLQHAHTLLALLEDAGEEARITLRVLGQVSDRAKILDIRREVYPLPRDMLTDDGQLVLDSALKMAEDLGRDLESLARSLAREILGTDDTRAPASLAESLPLGRLYWFSLDAAFPAFLDKLGRDDATAFWHGTLRHAAQEAWEFTRIFLGTQARHLKALARAERRFASLLAGIQGR